MPPMAEGKPRRTYGSGAVYQRGSDKRWVAVVRVGGRRRSAYRHSKAEAKAALADLWRDARTQDSRMPLGKYLAAWLDAMRPPRLRPSTWVSYDLHVRHLADLADIPIARLTSDSILQHVRGMTRDGLSPRSVGMNLLVLRMALRAAVRDGLVRENVAERVDPPRVPREEPVILTAGQVRAVIEDGDPLWTLLVTTGLRLGEALALRWSDVDTERGVVVVTGSIRPVPVEFRAKRAPRLQRVEPKSAAGRRVVALPVPLGLQRPTGAADDGYVFRGVSGGPRDPRAVSRAWGETRERLGLPAVTIHGLRHTAASLALAGGASLDDLKRMLGHSTIAMTSDLYGHAMEGRARDVADRLGDALRR